MLRDQREKPKTEKKTNTTNKGTKDLNPKTDTMLQFAWKIIAN